MPTPSGRNIFPNQGKLTSSGQMMRDDPWRQALLSSL